MEPLLFSAVAAFLAAWGDRTQSIVAALADGTKRPGAILLGLLVAAIVGNGLAAAGGWWLAGTLTPKALSLITALTLVSAGLFGLFPRKPSTLKPPRLLPVSAFILCLAAELGDRVQLFALAFAGRFAAGAPLAAAGASFGLLAACLPAALLGAELRKTVPVRAIRYGASALFLLAGFIVGVKTLQLA